MADESKKVACELSVKLDECEVKADAANGKVTNSLGVKLDECEVKADAANERNLMSSNKLDECGVKIDIAMESTSDNATKTAELDGVSALVELLQLKIM